MVACSSIVSLQFVIIVLSVTLLAKLLIKACKTHF